MKTEKVMIPEVTSKHLFALISHIYPAQKIPIKKIDGIFGRSKVANASATGVAIGLLVREGSHISLTKEGLDLGRALASKNLEEQRKILNERILENPALEFIYSLIKERRMIKNKEIGQKIAIQFNKDWKNEISYSRYGTNCGDILAAAGLGYYDRGVYSIDNISPSDDTEGSSVPLVRFKKILELLDELSGKERDIDSLVSMSIFGKSKNRLSGELGNCVDLKLVNKSGVVYSITQLGRELINPLNDNEAKKNLFAEVLRKSPYGGIIGIIEKNHITDKKKMGEIVLYELKRSGKENYQLNTGKIFSNWLSSAGIGNNQYLRLLEKNTSESFRIEKKSLPINKPKDETKEAVLPNKKAAEIKKPHQNLIFHIGRLIGILELKVSLKQDVINDLEELISVCKEVSSLRSYLKLLESHFSLYKESLDFRYLQADLDFLKATIGE